MSIHPDIPTAEATSVTHFLCHSGPTKEGQPVASHHLVPKRAGTHHGEPTWEQVCSYCERTEKQLRAELGLA